VSEWPHDLPPSVQMRARRVAALADAGTTEIAIAKRLGLSVQRVFQLLLIGDALTADETGILSPRLAAFRDVAQMLVDAVGRC
jgi:hypothetical protein